MATGTQPGAGGPTRRTSVAPIATGARLVSVFEREEDVIAGDRRGSEATGWRSSTCSARTPSHGLDRALGLRPTRLPWVCFLLGLSGAVTMAAFQYWATAVSWPINVGGKPWNSLPAFVPVTFEMMVLCAGVGTVAAFFWSTGLKPGRRLDAVRSARHRRSLRARARDASGRRGRSCGR